MNFHAQARLRVLLGDAIAMGPGKADLLDAIRRTGSISAAARDLGMSYRRAWTLVDTMNASFSRPLVEPCRGGAGGGGAVVTDCGLDVLAHYRALEQEVTTVLARHLAWFERHAPRRTAPGALVEPR